MNESDFLDEIQRLEQENKRLAQERRELHRTIAKIHEEYRPDVKAALTLKGWQQENAELQDRLIELEAEIDSSSSMEQTLSALVLSRNMEIQRLEQENKRMREAFQQLDSLTYSFASRKRMEEIRRAALGEEK